MQNKSFYITTPIFYPNARLHMGHAYCTTLADILARYHRLVGDSTYFLTGADENTEKLVRAAEKAGLSTEDYLDQIVGDFKSLFDGLSISYDQFIRTSDQKQHWPGAQLLWEKLVEAGDIEKRSYEGLYCIGHEAFITEKDLVNGKCPDHDEAPQMLKEENYFFKLSKYTSVIKEKIESGELQIIPETRRNEILALLSRGLEDISFSRPSEKMSVGIPVPHDPSQKIYVWGDALTNYITALGYGTTSPQPLSKGKGLETLPLGEGRVGLFEKFWPADVHVIGKDISRFHAAIWPAMLLSAKLPLPKKLLVHAFINSGGRKMSKSLGNVVDPQELIKDYGVEAVRYYLARHVSPFEDSDFTIENFKAIYNANLANGLGNLVSRIMKMASDNLESAPEIPEWEDMGEYFSFFETFEINKAADFVWAKISELDEFIQKNEPFKLVKTDKEAGQKMINELVIKLYSIARMLNPILPETSSKIKALIKGNKSPEAPLFYRKD